MPLRFRRTSAQSGKTSLVNRLFYGDNLDVLRERIPDEGVDLDAPLGSEQPFASPGSVAAGWFVPASAKPIRHQADEAFLCSRTTARSC